jgi:protein-S-isoprenylcysteine O-methyltransferase Ste14
MFVLRSKGGVAKGEGYVQTTVLVDSSIYSVVRHPQYLGWLLMYPAMMLFNPHWLIVGLGLLGMACVYLFTRQEDEHLVEKFGKPYGRYMQTVPRMNLIAGIVQLVRGTQRK